MYISPLVNCSRAFRQRISVLLPEPLGPIKATTSCLRTSKSTSLRTCLSPKNLLSLMARMIISSSSPLVAWNPFLELVAVLALPAMLESESIKICTTGTRPPLGDREEVASSFPMKIAISVSVLDQDTISIPNIGYPSLRSYNAESSTGFGSHAAYMHSSMSEPSRHHRTHLIPGPKRMPGGLTLGFSSWEAVLVHQAHLPAPMPVGCNA